MAHIKDKKWPDIKKMLILTSENNVVYPNVYCLKICDDITCNTKTFNESHLAHKEFDKLSEQYDKEEQNKIKAPTAKGTRVKGVEKVETLTKYKKVRLNFGKEYLSNEHIECYIHETKDWITIYEPNEETRYAKAKVFSMHIDKY